MAVAGWLVIGADGRGRMHSWAQPYFVNRPLLVHAIQSDTSTAGADQDRGRTVEELERELREAHRREAATAEILKIISRSSAQLQPVLNTITSTARRLCNAYDAGLLLLQNSKLRLVAQDGEIATDINEFPIDRELVAGRAVLDGKPVHIDDLTAAGDDFSLGREYAVRFGQRTTLGIPLIHNEEAIGSLILRRMEVHPFSDTQIRLLTTFADQAVIAIENARLFEEVQARTRELAASLEQQEATSEVLGVISRSPTQLQPVLNSIATTAARICDSIDAQVWRLDGENLKLVAQHGLLPRLDRGGRLPATRGSVSGRSIIDRRTIHVADIATELDTEYPDAKPSQLLVGHRTTLATPLLREGEPLGTILLRRTEVRPFSPGQIALLQTFADQAVIAIENTRLFEEVQARTRELTESLEQQTATADILAVISSSRAQLKPVFETIVDRTTHLSEATFACLGLFEGRALRFAATSGASAASDFFHPERLHQPDGCPYVVPLARATRAVQTPDVRAERGYHLERDPFYVIIADVGGARSALRVPLLTDGMLLGHLWAFRQEVRPFSDKQVDLVQNFAAQAVIAIENTRLLNELRESLQQQTATADVLKVISRSAFDLQAVLDALVESAAMLCGGDDVSILRLEGDVLSRVAHCGSMMAPPGYLVPAISGSVAGRSVLEGRPIHVTDLQAETQDYPEGSAIARELGHRTILVVPLLREGAPLGAITLRRNKVEPFADKQIELVKTFADQAVIAIENTRLFEEVQARTRELSDSLESQTAISEVLQVISSSPGELEPVFETMLANATRICSAKFGNLFLREGDVFRHVAMHGASPAFAELRRRDPVIRPGPHNTLTHVAATKQPHHVTDIKTEQGYLNREPSAVQLADIGGARTLLVVPMIKQNELVGAVGIYRQEVRPFTEKQIELVSNFAAQAVMAIENTRLLNELRESLEYQTATSDVLNVISRSKFDLQPVLDAIAESAARLCGGVLGGVFRYDGQRIHFGSMVNFSKGGIEAWRNLFPRPATLDTAIGRAILTRAVAIVPDVEADARSDWAREAARAAGYRSTLVVPMLREGNPVGVIAVSRVKPGSFPEAHVDLLQTFADQAVVAIENTRLFEEIAQKSRELEIASQHKSQFVANMSHELRTPLAAILGYAELMQEGFYEPLGKKSTDALTRIRSNGKHLLGLINTVLDIAKIESGQFSLNLGEYAIESMVETVRSATESLAETKKLSLKTDVAKKLPFGLGDEQRLTQVLLNLVGNAIKFTDTGEVRITATAMNSHFTVAVTDTGPGIPPEELKRVFEQFHQIDNSNTKAKGGTGLGLAIAKQIVEMHGGRIWVESTLGQGATFQMQLPIRAELRQRAP